MQFARAVISHLPCLKKKKKKNQSLAPFDTRSRGAEQTTLTVTGQQYNAPFEFTNLAVELLTAAVLRGYCSHLSAQALNDEELKTPVMRSAMNKSQHNTSAHGSTAAVHSTEN